MKESNNNKNLITKLVALFLVFIITMITTKIVVTKIGNEVYGFYDLSNDLVNYVLVITVALNSMGSRYITLSYYKNNNELNKYFNSIFISNIFLGTILLVPFSIAVIFLEDILSIPIGLILDIKILFSLMFLNFIISIIGSVFSTATFTKNRVDLDSYRSIESNIIRTILIFFLFYCLQPRIWYLGIATIISTVYVLIRNVFYTKQLLPEVKFSLRYFDSEKIKELILAGVWNSLTKISQILGSGFDLLISNIMIGSIGMGILAIARTIPKLFVTFISQLSVVFIPKITISYAKNEVSELLNYLKTSMLVNSCFTNIILSVMFALGTIVFKLWVPTQEINLLYGLSCISIFGYSVIMPLEPLWSIFTVVNKVKMSSIYLIIESVFRLICIVVFLCLFTEMSNKLFAIVVVSAAFDFIRGLLFLPIAVAYCLKIKPIFFYKSIMRSLLSSITSVVMCMYLFSLFNPNNWFVYIINLACCILFSLLFSFLFILSAKERKRFFSKLIKRTH